MDTLSFSFLKLLPNWGSLFEPGGLSTPDGFSALIVAILIGAALVFLLWAIFQTAVSLRKTWFFKRLLADVRPDELGRKRRELQKRAEQRKGCHQLWMEFDESLVSVGEDGQLFNTVDAPHFFNTHTLARGLTENRLLAAVPGFLTALGVIGTFAGLQMGLSNLQLTPESGVAELKFGINAMISGAAVAFLTSVWGVASSVVFNLLEKLLERWVRKEIAELQDQIDYLYPRMTAESSLAKIADFSQSSDEVLQGLAERIGTHMQEAMARASETIQQGLESSLSNVLQPAIESLVNNANQGSERALEGLVERFMEGFGSAGAAQREMMENAAATVQQSTSGLGTQLTDFLQELKSESDRSRQIAAEQQEQLQAQLRDLASSSRSQQTALTENFEQLLANLGSQMEQHQSEASRREVERQQALTASFESILESNRGAVDEFSHSVRNGIRQQEARDQERQEAFNRQLDGMRDSQAELITQVEGLTGQQQELFAGVVERLKAVQEGFSALINSNDQASNQVRESAGELKTASTQLGSMSLALKQATESLQGELSRAVNGVGELAQQNREVNASVQKQIESFESMSETLSGVGSTMVEAADSANEGYRVVSQHYGDLQQKLEKHLTRVQEQMASLLSEYSEQVQSQVQERMNQWNSQTQQYTGTMTNAIQTLAGVVDEIESKAGVVEVR